MNSTDEFEDEQFDPMDAPQEGESMYGESQSMIDKVRNSAILKLVVIMGVVGVALAGALGVFSEDKQEQVSKIAAPPAIKEAPGGVTTQFFREQNEQANDQRANEALQIGGSALPTPVGHDVSDIAPPKPDPMITFREETERLKKAWQVEQKQNQARMQQLQQQVNTVKAEPWDDSLAKAMQGQMQQLMESWAPKGMNVIGGVAEPTPVAAASAPQQQVYAQQQASMPEAPGPIKVLSAGTVNYMQLLTEANSDVPGPILAQILSGPFKGGRAIGAFQVMNDLLVMTFSQINYKGKTYAVNAMALDPNTTLGGMATEVDHRYFMRVVLPAAGAFVSSFGEALGDTESDTTVSNGTVLQDQAKKGYKEAIYAGLGSIGETVADFFKEEANKTKTLVRVAANTPMGIFFLSDVMDQVAATPAPTSNGAAMAAGYQQMMGVPQQKQAR